MSAYRICWTGVVSGLAVLAAAAGLLTTGLAGLVVGAATSAVLGALVGVIWAEETGDRVAVRCASWFAVFGVLGVGLPVLLGPWAILVLAAVVLGAPPVLAAVPRTRQPPDAPPPSDPGALVLSDRELERRWRLTTARLHHPGTTSEAALVLVRERSGLLDEIERRNPERFGAVIDRAIGWSDDSRSDDSRSDDSRSDDSRSDDKEGESGG